MKKKLILAFVVSLCVSNLSAQYGLGKLKEKVKDSSKKEEKKEEEKTSSTKTESSGTNASTSTRESAKVAPENKDPFGGSKYWTAEKTDYYVVDNGIKTDLHKNNIEKIIFTRKKTDPATATAADGVTTFNINESIYGLVFMKTAIGNYKIYNPESGAVKGNLGSNYEVRVTIDGNVKKYTILQDNFDDGKKGTTAFSMPVHSYVPGDEGENTYYLVEDVNALTPGNHTIRIEVWGGNTNMKGRTMEAIAAGEFTLVKKAGDMMKLGRNFSMIKAKKTDKALETQMLSTMKTYAAEHGNKFTFTAVKITDADWLVKKNSLGAIINRSISASGLATDESGKCTIHKILFTQDYEGGGYQKSMFVDIPYKEEPIDCK